MEAAKLNLSHQQIALVTNTAWILTKNEILQSVKKGLEALYCLQNNHLNNCDIDLKIFDSTGKISKGENYEGLPYMILDYPRYFEKENIFAIRSMFWWGQFFSTTLHLSGRWLAQVRCRLLPHFSNLREHGFVINQSYNEWLHDLRAADYLPLKNINFEHYEKLLYTQPFIKIGVYTNIQEINNAPEILFNQFKVITGVLQ